MQALRDALSPALATLPLESRQGQGSILRSPRIYLGQLPPRQANAPFEAPFVLIQALGGHEDAEGFARAEIALRVCVWNDETEANENDLHNLLATIRHALIGYRNTALNGRYILAPDSSGIWLAWTRPDEQASGFAEAYILSQWKMQGYC